MLPKAKLSKRTLVRGVALEEPIQTAPVVAQFIVNVTSPPERTAPPQGSQQMINHPSVFSNLQADHVHDDSLFGVT